MYAIITFLPIIVLIVLLVGFNLPAKMVMPIAWVICVILASVFWKMDMLEIMAFSVLSSGLSIEVFNSRGNWCRGKDNKEKIIINVYLSIISDGLNFEL